MNSLFYILIAGFGLNLTGIIFILRGYFSNDKKMIKNGLNACIAALIFQVFVILSQLYLVYFISKVSSP
jgi:hypothetical protein